VRLRRLAAAALSALLLAPAAAAAASEPAQSPLLTEERATRLFLATPKVADWVERYTPSARTTDATYDDRYRDWTVRVWADDVGEIAFGRVDDPTGRIKEAWTGPQVAWTMARGREGAFGGKQLNSLPVWLAFCGVFLLGLADLRRPLSLRNLDLLVCVSFTASLVFFNDGRIFTSVPLVYPPLAYLLLRTAWIGARGRRADEPRPVWPVWALAAATVFLLGFRIGLVVKDSNVIDVGYAGLIGAHRIWNGQAPYGHMPVEESSLRPCGLANRDGRIVERIQTNGRCEGANPRGDTYGPVTYQAYVPGFLLFDWKGKGSSLDAARFTAVVFDALCVLGLVLVGRRFGGARLAVTLAFAWAAYPFTQYVASSSSNDAVVPALLIFGFWLASSAAGRGALLALAAWTKFAPLVLVPLWATYPRLGRPLRPALQFGAAFLGATLVSFWILLLEPDPLHAARVLWDRTLGWQLGRESPFSIWDWAQYRAGLPDLEIVQQVLGGLLAVGALMVAVVPRRKTPLQLAALTGAIVIGFELVLTHWFYLYLVWFFPFLAFALLAPAPAELERPDAPEPHERALAPST
jgi:hypothetical protein